MDLPVNANTHPAAQRERTGANERLVRHERRNSLSALLRAINFGSNAATGSRKKRPSVQQHFAQLRPQARQHSVLPEDNYWVRSAN